ncbi:MAG TPA: hypothetical protein VFP65_14300 [Anaeromyxobacteraceae bacterium]|nr:hypothetical protein [Anaeromyxobacteraceae bacterium]
MTEIGQRAARLLRSRGARHGLVLGSAMLVAGALDYGVSVLTGRWLGPAEFGVFVAVTALLQVLLSVATAIRMVVAFHGAAIDARPDGTDDLAAFLGRVRRWCCGWGLAATAAAVALAPALAGPLRLASPWPLWAACGMVLMLFLREATLGALQGIQAFGALGVVQVGQAALRLALAAALVLLGAGASGAIAAQPLAAVGAVAIGLAWLRPWLRRPERARREVVSASYAAWTVLGLAAIGLLTNLDALVVKMTFPPRLAGDYGAVVTFERISFFIPCALSFVLFPKSAQRSASGRDARPILLLALAGSLAPGLALSALYLVAPGAVVRRVFTADYADPGLVLALACLAGTLYAGVNIWLNYALSTGRQRFVLALLAVVGAQGAAMFAAAGSGLVAVAACMVAGGAVANVGGWLTTWAPPRAAPEQRGEPSSRPAPGAVEGGA